MFAKIAEMRAFCRCVTNGEIDSRSISCRAIGWDCRRQKEITARVRRIGGYLILALYMGSGTEVHKSCEWKLTREGCTAGRGEVVIGSEWKRATNWQSRTAQLHAGLSDADDNAL